MNPAATILVALAAGALLGALHMRTLRRAVAQAVARGSAAAFLLAAPLRVALPALGLAGAAVLGGGPGVGGALVGYALAVQLARWRAAAPRGGAA